MASSSPAPAQAASGHVHGHGGARIRMCCLAAVLAIAAGCFTAADAQAESASRISTTPAGALLLDAPGNCTIVSGTELQLATSDAHVVTIRNDEQGTHINTKDSHLPVFVNGVDVEEQARKLDNLTATVSALTARLDAHLLERQPCVHTWTTPSDAFASGTWHLIFKTDSVLNCGRKLAQGTYIVTARIGGSPRSGWVNSGQTFGPMFWFSGSTNNSPPNTHELPGGHMGAHDAGLAGAGLRFRTDPTPTGDGDKMRFEVTTTETFTTLPIQIQLTFVPIV